MRFDEFPVFSVTEINSYVRGVFSRDELLNGLRLRGEISNLKLHSSGHMYFSLKDAGARIGCVLFRQHSYGLRVPLRDGMSCLAQGYVSLYERDGQYQFYVESIEPDGVGALYALYEETKRKLQKRGYFDAAHKKSLPQNPSVIGVVTSSTGAVIRDIVRVARRRDPGVGILLCPARVQGEGAALEIADAISRLSTQGVDVILCGRGGGSLEDLWAFNEEIVAEAIYRCPIPVVSCVGHETDFTISDLVADVRAATPSQAAEIAVPDTGALRQRLDLAMQRLHSRTEAAFARRQSNLSELNRRLRPAQFLHALLQSQKMLRKQTDRLRNAAYLRQTAAEEKLGMTDARLRSLDPGQALRRGYAVLETDSGFLSRASMLHVGQRVCVQLYDGEARARIEDIRINEGITDERKKEEL